MENNAMAKLDSELGALFDSIKEMDPTTEEYRSCRDAIVELYKLRIDEEHVMHEADAVAIQTKKESRMEIARIVTQVATTALTVGVGILSIWIQVNGSSTMVDNILKFEETGTVASKAMSIVPKITFRTK